VASGEETSTQPAMTSSGRSLGVGWLTNITNPKTAVFTASLFAASLPPEPPFLLGALAIAVMGLVSLSWYTIVVFVFSLRKPRQMYGRARKLIERLVGSVFIGLGVRLSAQP